MTHGCLEKANGIGQVALVLLMNETFINTEPVLLRYETRKPEVVIVSHL